MTEGTEISSRFVLPADAPYLKNLAALWTAHPALAAQIEAIEIPAGYRVEPSKAGVPTLAAPTADGRTVYLHSRYEPLAEATKLVEPAKTDTNLVFYVFGCGLGYHIKLLFEKAAGEAMICVFEADLNVLRIAFEQIDYSQLIESRRVWFFARADKSEIMTRLTGQAALMAVGIQEITHIPSQQASPEFYAQIRRDLEEFASYGRTSLQTLVLNSKRTAENIARNVGWYLSGPCISRLKDLHKGEPAIIVSAGPSLRKNKHLLKDLADKAVLIAVQTTLQPLLEMGVEPRFVTTLDYHQISAQFYEKLPRNLAAELVADSKANAAILKAYPGPVSVLGNTFAEGLLREMQLNKARLRDGATVAHLAYYLAEHLGCDPIIFIGQDLGFGDGLCYTPGTSHEDVWRPELSRFGTIEMKQWDVIVRERFILRRIPDFEGRPMYTEERLFTYLQQFERDFAHARARVIDATEGGAAKRGATVMPLASAIAEFCTRPLSGLRAQYPGINTTRDGAAIDCLRRRCGEAREIERISRQTLPLLEEIRDHNGDQTRVNRAIASIDTLRARMNELGPCYDLVTQLTQNTEFERFKTDRRIAASKACGVELQKKQVDRDIGNVRGVMNAAADFQKLMDEVIELLQERGEEPIAGEEDGVGVEDCADEQASADEEHAPAESHAASEDHSESEDQPRSLAA
ncbi:MAG TPA: 6-hydroxymethylpterin diphosphokinase MptE-like protein [Humisphaera sp.]|jgi:hypothetical protein|nr:6-hydroxymethylpterin diphosphokinase MptE-like protein [Humisphaera sp.]